MLERLGRQLLYLYEGGEGNGVGLVRVFDEDHVQVMTRDGRLFSITRDGETVSVLMVSRRRAAAERETAAVCEEPLVVSRQ